MSFWTPLRYDLLLHTRCWLLGEFSTLMQTLDCVSGLHNCLDFSQLPLVFWWGYRNTENVLYCLNSSLARDAPFFKSVSLVVFEPKSTVVLVHQFFALKRILLKKRYIFHLPRVKMWKAVTRFRKSLLKTASILKLPCEQLVSPTLPERETTASNRLIFHRACAKYVTSHVMYLTSLRLISREISTQQAHPNAPVT